MATAGAPEKYLKYTCSLCHSFASPNFEAVLRHIGSIHSFEPNFRITCGVDGCPRTYTSYRSYRKHILKKHGSWIKESDSGCHREEENEDFDLNNNSPQSSFVEKPAMYDAALFILKAKEVRRISQRALNGLLFDVSELQRNHIMSLATEVNQCLVDMNCGEDVIAKVDDIIKGRVDASLFEGLETEYLQCKYYSTNFNYVEPIERKLGQYSKVVTSGTSSTIKLKWDYVYDIPLLSSLKQQLGDSHILEEVLSGHSRQDDVLQDYCDGSEFKKHPLYLAEPQSLQVMLYFDDVELCNPLGSSSKIHKIGVFYYQLGNLSPQFRSSLLSIHLVAIAKSSVIQKYGPNKILETFMKDIRKLEAPEGVFFCLGNPPQEFRMRGTVTLVSGDNLGSHFIGGYKQLSSAHRKCRFCMAVDPCIGEHFYSHMFDPRTRKTHAHHCSLLDENDDLRSHIATTYGLYWDSILNSSQFFHVTEGLPPDIMHDILEGSLQYEVKELLRHLIKEERLFTLELLNEKIERFPYMQSDIANKPALVPDSIFTAKSNTVKQKASKMWCLARYLPLMVGDITVPEDNEKWLLFLSLLTIIDYVFAPKCTSDTISYVRLLIHDHLVEFKRLYPNCHIIPKQHYMIHIPDWMERCGPMTRYWCMRYEAKHNYFKDLAQKMKCFKNICKSLAERHQHLICYQYLTSNVLLKDIEVGKTSQMVADDLPYFNAAQGHPYLRSGEVYRAKYICTNGIQYSEGSVVVLSVDIQPSFGLIKDILIYDVDDCVLVCEILECEGFVEHFHAYKVCRQNPILLSFCKQTDLKDYHTLSLHQKGTSLYIVTKYHLL